MRALLLRKGKKEVDRREGREEEGICRTNVKVIPTCTPLHFEAETVHFVSFAHDTFAVFLLLTSGLKWRLALKLNHTPRFALVSILPLQKCSGNQTMPV